MDRQLPNGDWKQVRSVVICCTTLAIIPVPWLYSTVQATLTFAFLSVCTIIIIIKIIIIIIIECKYIALVAIHANTNVQRLHM